jgi:hypothetical protein
MYLHVVSFDIPYPANYGGVIVIFNQIKALHAQGVQVILHCFQYGKRLAPQPELEKYCYEVHYYKRDMSIIRQISLKPFIMRSRQSSALLKRLRKDNHPILFEGMHTAAYVTHKKLRHRQKIVRMHNIEWQYYESLSELTDSLNLRDKAYYFIESLKLQRIEPEIVLHADELITISTNDTKYYQNQKAATQYIPVFHPNKQVESALGRGKFVLFHGKLSIPDNERAAIWLIHQVFSKMDIPFIIAGLEPSDNLKSLIAEYENITLIENPEDTQMNQLIRDAHINLLVSFQNAGMKLKLVNALFRGRFCICNEQMVSGTGLEKLCYVKNSANAIRQTVEALLNAPFEQSKIEERRSLLETEYSNLENAKKLIDIVKFQA